MIRVGRHNPTSPANVSTLWAYAESPVTSAKLNAWTGNLEAGFWLLHRIVRLLADNDGEPFVFGEEGASPLRVRARTTPNLAVRVEPGFAFGPMFLVGLSEEAVLPEVGAFAPPTGNPRIDAIGVDEQGEWAIATGDEAESPIAPALAEDVTPLCEIHWRVGASSIEDEDDSLNAFLVDVRPPQLSTRAHRHSTVEQPEESPDGSRTMFSTSRGFVPGSLRVHANGLLQIPGVHFTEAEDASGYEFATAPPTGYVLAHEFQPR